MHQNTELLWIVNVRKVGISQLELFLGSLRLCQGLSFPNFSWLPGLSREISHTYALIYFTRVQVRATFVGHNNRSISLRFPPSAWYESVTGVFRTSKMPQTLHNPQKAVPWTQLLFFVFTLPACRKVVCMNILLYSSIVVTALEKPWRAMACNFLDLALVTGMLAPW